MFGRDDIRYFVEIGSKVTCFHPSSHVRRNVDKSSYLVSNLECARHVPTSSLCFHASLHIVGSNEILFNLLRSFPAAAERNRVVDVFHHGWQDLCPIAIAHLHRGIKHLFYRAIHSLDHALCLRATWFAEPPFHFVVGSPLLDKTSKFRSVVRLESFHLDAERLQMVQESDDRPLVDAFERHRMNLFGKDIDRYHDVLVTVEW